MAWGLAYLGAALTIFLLGLWAGLAQAASTREALEEELAATKIANAAIKEQASAALRATGVALQNVRARWDTPPGRVGVRSLLGVPPDPPKADPPAGGAAG